MQKKVYFIEPDSSLMSDIEVSFMIQPDLDICGNNPVFSQAESEIKSNPSISCVILAQSALDTDCITAIKKLYGYGIAVIVCVNPDCDADTMVAIESNPNCYCLKKPYNISELVSRINSAITKLSAANDAVNPVSAPAQPEVMTPVSQVVSQTMQQDYQTQPPANEFADNPYIPQTNDNINVAIPDLREKMRKIRREQPTDNTQRIIPQQVIVIHNQKGGVGKSSIAVDLSVAISKLKLMKNNETYQPKVCLVDFDLDACDIATMIDLNLSSSRNSGTMVNDLKVEAKRRTASKGRVEAVQNILFSQRDIEQKYLHIHETGIYVLAAPNNKKTSALIREDEVKAILNNLRACDFDIIIIDTGPNFLSYTIATLIAADTIYAVSTCEMTSAGRLSGIIQDFKNIQGYMTDKTKLIINKYDKSCNISPEQVAQILQCELYGVIPMFQELSNVRNEGYSVFNCPIAVNETEMENYADAIMALAKRTLGVQNREPAKQEKPRKQGFFSRLFRR